MNISYPPPVDKLLTYGDCRNFLDWPDYLALGFTHEHVNDLIRMATSEELNWADSDSLEVWAPIHAWRVLGQLKAEAAIEPLVNFFNQVEEDDWAPIEFPTVLSMIGPAAIPRLAEFLLNPANKMYPRSYAGDSLAAIAKKHPEARETCVKLLAAAIKLAEKNSPGLNGFILANLLDLKAVEAAPEIERAFAAEAVDPSIAGDWEDVQVEFGLLEARITKPAHSVFDRLYEGSIFDDEEDEDDEIFVEDIFDGSVAPLFHNNRKKRDAVKIKSRKAMAKKSRRQNRKKKKKK